MDFDMHVQGIFMMSHYHVILPLAVLLSALFYYLRLSKESDSFVSKSKLHSVPSQQSRNTGSKAPIATPRDGKKLKAKPTASKPIQFYRNLFHQLQHLEDHPVVLEAARDELLAMFSRGISLALDQPKGSILHIEHYNTKSVWSFIGQEHDRALTEWSSYLERRKQGQGPELFATTEAAKAWLKEQAPVKFVDGAWLAHIHKITTPFALRSVTKDSWQVFSEELGDGDLTKHHVYLYRKLLEDVGCHLPDGHNPDFVEARLWEGIDNRDAWEAAVGQLLISLFPNEFLPEIIGFNMHYELITLDTMRAAHELKALKINPYYFLIHIAIDNADSGHTAMATHTVTRYLDMIRATEGEAAVEQAWKRVQVGYTLSQTLGSSLSHERESSNSAAIVSDFAAPKLPLDPLSARVIDIFKAKASFSHQFHCQSRARIGSHTLAEWLAPNMWEHPHPGQHLELLTALSQAKPWIYPGASNKSLLVRELSWEGRMFGAFTHDEVVALTTWIDSLGPDNNSWPYWSLTRRTPLSSKEAVGELQDPARHHPVIIPSDTVKIDTTSLMPESQEPEPESELHIEQYSLAKPSDARLPDVVALWFAHIGLLENTINTPSRTASPLYASILRLLRAQAGFAIETHIVAGMDEMNRDSCPSLVDLGQELISRAGWATSVELSCLQDVFLLTGSQGQGKQSAGLADDMLRWGARPSENLGLLLGLAMAFLELKDAVATAPGLLGQDSRVVLKAIVARERQSLEECAQELRLVDGAQYKQLVRGYHLARAALESCL